METHELLSRNATTIQETSSTYVEARQLACFLGVYLSRPVVGLLDSAQRELTPSFVHWARGLAAFRGGKTKRGRMANRNLSNARSAKNDEFYTQYADIQA